MLVLVQNNTRTDGPRHTDGQTPRRADGQRRDGRGATANTLQPTAGRGRAVRKAATCQQGQKRVARRGAATSVGRARVALQADNRATARRPRRAVYTRYAATLLRTARHRLANTVATTTASPRHARPKVREAVASQPATLPAKLELGFPISKTSNPFAHQQASDFAHGVEQRGARYRYVKGAPKKRTCESYGQCFGKRRGGCRVRRLRANGRAAACETRTATRRAALALCCLPRRRPLLAAVEGKGLASTASTASVATGALGSPLPLPATTGHVPEGKFSPGQGPRSPRSLYPRKQDTYFCRGQPVLGGKDEPGESKR